MRNAGSVKIAPAATDSPMDPAVRAMFSSRTDPFIVRKTAMPTTAAGYVAAIVIPARRPRYAFAAPKITVITNPNSNARRVNSRISKFAGTKGRKRRGCSFIGCNHSKGPGRRAEIAYEYDRLAELDSFMRRTCENG